VVDLEMICGKEVDLSNRLTSPRKSNKVSYLQDFYACLTI
jgi:hypothetical protein